MSYIFKIQLTQLTPLLHFQYGWPGATLRATEFKPKFDRFLIANEFCSPNEGKKTLDYKVTITVDDQLKENNLYPPNKFLFFGNMGSDGQEKQDTKELVKHKQIKLTFMSFNSKLIETIKEKICIFFALHNFGTRQSKGYGGFYPVKSNDYNYISFQNALEQCVKLKVSKDDERCNKCIAVFELTGGKGGWEKRVVDFHKLLKAGINNSRLQETSNNESDNRDMNEDSKDTKYYQKSLLCRYMIAKGIRWEKRKIKKTYPELVKRDAVRVVYRDRPNDRTMFVRALLGLTSQYKYGKKSVNVDDTAPEQDRIVRFRSPITYKVNGNSIYIICFNSYESLFGKRFKFSLEESSGEPFVLSVPNEKEFDLLDFMREAGKMLETLDLSLTALHSAKLILIKDS